MRFRKCIDVGLMMRLGLSLTERPVSACIDLNTPF